mmetsp:Transcript_41857/g.105576  ORF Transcript_41857/g.105576 Transcript_41857/m.105576 type:complete len:232 (+) Transcript_41857:310-1005(+)
MFYFGPVGMDPFNTEEETLLIAIIDGTSCPVKNPQDHSAHRRMWVHYKLHTAWRYFVLVTSDGHIVYVSEAKSGNINDEQEYLDSGVIKELEKFYGADAIKELKEHEHLTLGGDKGYVRCMPPSYPDGGYWNLLITKSGENELLHGSTQTNPDLDDAVGRMGLRRLDERFAPARSVVERTIGKIKAFRRLSQGSLVVRMGTKVVDAMVYVAAVHANHLVARTYSEYISSEA